MRRIDTKVYTYLENGGFGSYHVREVAQDSGFRIDHYEELVDVVAKLSYRNPLYSFLFRGQHRDYRQGDRPEDPSAILPSLWRKGLSRRNHAFKVLMANREHLLRLNCLSRGDKGRLKMIPERPWAILQHYSDVAKCETPLLDVTENLRVAASFATQRYLESGDNENSTGVVFVLGFPAIYQGTTISIDDGLVMLRLSSVCTPAARRPHSQCGYLVGTYPTENLRNPRPKNFAHRLIAKLKVSTKSSFWNVDKPLEQHALFPDEDPLRDEIASAFGYHT